MVSLSNIENYDKLRASILYILSSTSGIEIMKLAKILYLSDYLFAKTFGNKHGFMGGHKRFEFGPVPDGFYPVYNELDSEGIVVKRINTVTLEKPQTIDGLSENEIACIDKTLEEYKHQSLNSVKTAAYETEPMKLVQQREASLGSTKLMYETMDFSSINLHPLFDNESVDTDFMNDPEFIKNLE